MTDETTTLTIGDGYREVVEAGCTDNEIAFLHQPSVVRDTRNWGIATPMSEPYSVRTRQVAAAARLRCAPALPMPEAAPPQTTPPEDARRGGSAPDQLAHDAADLPLTQGDWTAYLIRLGATDAMLEELFQLPAQTVRDLTWQSEAVKPLTTAVGDEAAIKILKAGNDLKKLHYSIEADVARAEARVSNSCAYTFGDTAPRNVGNDAQPAESWPEPRHGVMADLVTAVLDSANVRRPVAALGAVVAAMSAGANALFHRKDGTRANSYTTIVMPSGGGKEALIRGASEIVRAAGSYVEGKPASGAALEMLLMPYRSLLLVVNEAAPFLASIGAQDAPAYLRDLSAVMLKAYSDSAYRYLPRSRAEEMKNMNAGQLAKYREDRQKGIEHPSLSVLMLTQEETLAEALNAKNVTEGTLPRMLLVLDDAKIGMAGVVRQHEPQPFRMPASASAAAAAVREVLRQRLGEDPSVSYVAVPTVTIERTDEAAERLAVIMDECDRNQLDGVVSHALMTRHAEKIVRLSAALAVWDAPAAPMVTGDMVDWAAEFVGAADTALCRFVGEKVGLSDRLQHVERVRDVIGRLLSKDLKPAKDRTTHVEWLRRGYVPVAAVLRHTKLSAYDLDIALGHLAQLEEIDTGTAADLSHDDFADGREARARLIVRRA